MGEGKLGGFFRKVTGQPAKQQEEESQRERALEEYKKVVKKLFSTESLVAIVGSELHDEWRAPRKKEDSTFEPRIKKTKDEKWVASHEADEVDIANTAYDQLPEDWKGENKISAQIAIDEVLKAETDLNAEFIEHASSILHDKWLERNGSWAPEDQKKPYARLSEEEKEKDRVIVRKAIERYTEMEELKRALKVAEQVIGKVYDESGELKEYYTRYGLDGNRYSDLIKELAARNKLGEKEIDRCLEILESGNKSAINPIGVRIRNPYSSDSYPYITQGEFPASISGLQLNYPR